MSHAELVARHTDAECSEKMERAIYDDMHLNVHVFKEGKKILYELATSRARLMRMGEFFQARIERWRPGAITITLAEMEWKAFKKLVSGEELKRHDVSLPSRVAADYCL